MRQNKRHPQIGEAGTNKYVAFFSEIVTHLILIDLSLQY